jgi:hypothetical protein
MTQPNAFAKPRQMVGLEGEPVAAADSNRHGGYPQGILSPLEESVNIEEIITCSETTATPTSRADSETKLDPDLARLIAAWPTLPPRFARASWR